MKAKIHWGKFGPWFSCSQCHATLEEDAPFLIHRQGKMFYFARDIACEHVGKRFLNPLSTVDLKEA